MLDAIAPAEDEIVMPKTSSSVFISTNIDYVLRNLGVRSLIIAGVLTDQCIDSAVRDACDLGYLVTVPTDACATLSTERHEWALRNNRGYCRQVTTTSWCKRSSKRGVKRRGNLLRQGKRTIFRGFTPRQVCFASSISARRYASPSSGERSTPIRAR